MRSLIVVLVLAILGLGVSQCKKDVITMDADAYLDFSEDTVLFDTVFTTVGSTTKALKVYNNNRQRISISHIALAGGNSSNFRINVDGVPGVEFRDVEIAAEDSLWIFVEVTVDPNGGNSPMVISDSIIFQTNGNIQDVDLVAWGQDAHFHVADRFDSDQVWTNDKPHVVYDFVWVDSSHCLTIEAGAQVYVHDNTDIFIYKGCLDVNGQPGNPVVFQGDRLEPFYDDVVGQWNGIWFLYANDSHIDHAVIKNAHYGVRVDSVNDQFGGGSIELTNIKIENMSLYGIWSQTGTIRGENISVLNCGVHAAAFTGGGDLQFGHCTFSSYFRDGTRQDPGFILTNYIASGNQVLVYPVYNARFDNCVIEGSNDEEFLVDMDNSGSTFNYYFNHCLIKTEESVTDATHFGNIFKNEDPGFVDAFERNVHLIDGAYAIDKGDPNYMTILPAYTDLDGWMRDALPDLGCFEFQ